MRRPILLAALALVPATAVAGYYEAEHVFTYYGTNANVIAREPGHYDEQQQHAVEVECNGQGTAAHLVMTTDEARKLGDSLMSAADEAEEL